jgi:hypothetical protein
VIRLRVAAYLKVTLKVMLEDLIEGLREAGLLLSSVHVCFGSV